MTLVELGKVRKEDRTAAQCMVALRLYVSKNHYGNPISPLFLNFVPEHAKKQCEAQCMIEDLFWPKT